MGGCEMSLKAARTLWLSVNLADYTVRCVRVPYTCFGTFEAYSERNVMNCGVTLTNFFFGPWSAGVAELLVSKLQLYLFLISFW